MKSKLNIEDIKLLIPDYITGSLGNTEANIVENAINSNSEIAELYNDMKNALDFAGSVKLEEPAPQYWNNLLPRIHEKIEEKGSKGLFKFQIPVIWKVLVPIAAIILIAVIYKISFTPEKQITEKKNEIIKQEQKTESNDQQKVETNTQSKTENKENEVIKNNLKESNIRKNRVTAKENNPPSNLEENNVNNGKLKENEPVESKLIEEFASVDINDLSAITDSEVSGFDEEMENEVDKLNSNDKEILLEELRNTNL
jgi:hypothetical protein